MELFLMRHADAGRPDPYRYPDDSQRPLSEVGERTHHVMARTLAPLLQPLDYLLSSPLLRARQTASIVAAALPGGMPIEPTDMLGGSCTVGGVIDLFQEYPRQARLLCVGHEPSMSRLSAVFLDGHGLSRIAFQPGALIGLAFDGYPAPGRALLRCFLRAADLLCLGENDSESLPGPADA